MLEAIGHAQYPTFFRGVDRLLAPGGRACVQAIAMPDERYERYRRHDDWIRRYIFPGSLLPSVEALEQGDGAARRSASRRWTTSARTTRRPCRRGASASSPALDDVRRLGYDERFVRTWEFYLAYCEAAFRTRSLRDVQLVCLTR